MSIKIAIRKRTFRENLDNLPELLLENEGVESVRATYFVLEEDWDSQNSDIAELQKFLRSLDEEDFACIAEGEESYGNLLYFYEDY